MAEDHGPRGPIQPSHSPSSPAAKEIKVGLGMPKALFVLVLIAALAAGLGTGLVSRWNLIVIAITVLLSLAVIAAVSGNSQTDLQQFKREHNRWPREDELEAWNQEMHGRRENAKRVAASATDVKTAERTHRQQVSHAEKALQVARREHADAVNRARAVLSATEAAHANAVAQATSALNAWHNPGRGGRIATFKGVELYQHAIVTRRRVGPLLHAQAFIAGHFLTVHIGGDQEVIKLSKQEVPGAFQFVSQLMAAAAAEMSFEQQRPSAVPVAKTHLEHVTADTAAIESARDRLATVETDAGMLAAVEAAERALSSARADTAAIDAARSDLHANQESRIERPAPVPPPTWLPKRSNAAVSLIGILVVAGVVGGIGAVVTAPPSPSSAVVHPQPTVSLAESPISTPSPTPTEAATISAAVRPTPTDTPPSAPVPTLDPHSLTIGNVQKSISDNQSLMVSDNFDALQVSIDGGTVNVQAKPSASWDEKQFFQMGAADAVVSSKAILGWYPSANKIHVVVLTDFTDQYGKSSTEPGVWLDVSADTASKFDYNGLKDRVLVQPSLMYCDADAHYIHPAIWKKLDSETRGCLL
jgi:hypothetical protein